MKVSINLLVITLVLCNAFDVNAQPITEEKLTLEDCIRIAMEKHQSLAVSDANIAMAEAQYQQAMSAYWHKYLHNS